MIKRLLLLFIFTFTSSYAVTEQNMKQVMDTKIKQVIKILKSKSLSQTQKDKKKYKDNGSHFFISYYGENIFR